MCHIHAETILYDDQEQEIGRILCEDCPDISTYNAMEKFSLEEHEKRFPHLPVASMLRTIRLVRCEKWHAERSAKQEAQPTHAEAEEAAIIKAMEHPLPGEASKAEQQATSFLSKIFGKPQK